MKAASATILALAAPLLIGARAPTLVPDVSRQSIDIVYSFTGADLLLFGAILYPGGRTPADVPDVAVVVKGPARPLRVREKAKVGGIWINRQSARFAAVPSFYAVASTRSIGSMVDPGVAADRELGIANLRFARPNGTPRDRFAAGLVAMRREAGLFVEHPGAVSLREGVLYRATVPIPARVPVGRYTAETFLIRDGHVVAMATRTIAVDKTGFERFVAEAAVHRPLGYGLVAVGLSLALGWAAAMLFRRRGR